MTDNKATLVILSPGFPANEADSTCLPAQQQLITALNEQFPQVKLIILAFQYPFSAKPYQWKGNSVIPFNGRNRAKLSRLLVWIRVWRKLNSLQKQSPLIGLLSFWYGECGLIGNLFGRKNQPRHFTWLLGQDAGKTNRYVRLLRPRAAELVALSDFLVKEFEKNHGIIPAHTIPLGIDPRLYAGTPPRRDIDILAAGSLIALKRYDIFIEVVKTLKQKLPFIHAVLCGEGPERSRLEAMITAAGLQDSISLIGEKPHHEVLQLMQRCKLFLHPSSYEGFGIVCLEALYAGAQVISFCDPKKEPIPHWHITADTDSMIALSYDLLHCADPDHTPVLPYAMADTAHSVMKLFGYSEAATS